MGRKPNALILEFFERGPKLNDQSNRYQHTCKRCGEVFPKGRPDSLTRHLFEKCPKITEADRARALWQPAESTLHLQSTSAHYLQQSMAVDMLPFAPQRQPSGLDALAEVSRQLQANGEVGVGAEEAIMAHLQQHMDDDPKPSIVDQLHPAASLTRSSSSPSSSSPSPSATPSATPPNLGLGPSPGLAPAPAPAPAPPDAVATPILHPVSSTDEQLAEAAMQQSQSNGIAMTSANVARSRKRKASSAPDPTIPNSYLSYYSERPPPAVDPQLHHHPADPSHPTASHDADQSPAFAMTPGGFGLLQRANKTKARGRFSEERRKEVQNVRKKGACLRCRMLKKPCSEGTPCGTCKNIEAARLWKGACIRTRVADEFGLYSTTYFYSKDRAKVFASLNCNEPQAVNGRIEATLFPHSNLYGTFPALKTDRGGRTTAARLDPDLDNNRQHSVSADTYLLSFKTEDSLALKLERYVVAATGHFISNEPSPVIKATLELASELSAEHDDELLTKFMHLWAATNILVSKELLWSISFNPRDPPVADHITIVDETEEQGQASTTARRDDRVHFAPDSQDYDIIHAQLQDAAERYCQKQAKTCLNELERRLLQRQQSSTFMTFLAAVIMLNCVERMTALYYSFDPHADAEPSAGNIDDEHAANHDDDHAKAEITPLAANGENRGPDRTPDWPLAESPSSLWPQGRTFAGLLQLLLRMRGLPPTIHINDDGTLAIVSNFNKAYPVVVTTNTDGGDSQQQMAAQWIERTGLRAKELWRVHNLGYEALNKQAWGKDEGQDKGARAWDLKYLAPLLLPTQHG